MYLSAPVHGSCATPPPAPRPQLDAADNVGLPRILGEWEAAQERAWGRRPILTRAVPTGGGEVGGRGGVAAAAAAAAPPPFSGQMAARLRREKGAAAAAKGGGRDGSGGRDGGAPAEAPPPPLGLEGRACGGGGGGAGAAGGGESSSGGEEDAAGCGVGWLLRRLPVREPLPPQCLPAHARRPRTIPRRRNNNQ